ncbi:TRAP transporter permease [Dethiosulfatarculus sandiegensis]|uniref:TRAP transporter permease n=1 Tax=Dethiosulfatarculus sandiegensis TaxID=1429043 RepID=UPI0005C86EF1|nr:TRAP transporter permease [Dethiosulfatarculus sandiegensis]
MPDKSPREPVEGLETQEDQGAKQAQKLVEEAEIGSRVPTGWQAWVIPVIAAAWSIYQMLLPQVLLLEAVYIRAIHLAFAIILVYLSYPLFKKREVTGLFSFLSDKTKITWLDFLLAGVAGLCALYIALDYENIATRQGLPTTRDIVVGVILIVLLLEAARRSLGPALTIVASVFILYSFFGPYMPDVIAFKGVSFSRFMSQQTISTEGIFGIPLDVSATIVFLFVLLGSMMEKAGGGRYFVDLAFSMLGTFKGGPAKAAVLASGLTGMVSGSSIANVVTTGTFTIPLMKSVGYPAKKAAAVEVAASTNGQLMPPIMGAAAFIIAEYCNLPYIEVVKAAFVPAVISYIALFYITHLEAGKLGLHGVPRVDLPPFLKTLMEGIHFLIPLIVLIYELMWLRHSPQLAAYNAILILAALIVIKCQVMARREGKDWVWGIKVALVTIWESLVAGGRNMMGIGVAVSAAGIIVGVVTMGLGGLITEVVDVISGGNLYLLLIITAVACLLLGMGLPTTANYIVMASLTAKVITELAPDAGLEVHLISAHLFVFFFGILADDTPPVGLAAYAAAAIAKSDPIPTGVQGFMYDIRTAILPFMFIFNERLLLIGVHTWLEAIWIFITGVLAMFAFACATQGYFIARNKWYEGVVFLLITFMILRPEGSASLVGINEISPDLVISMGIVVYGLMWVLQRPRQKADQAALAA